MNKKIIIIGFILLFLMISINSINASDTNNTKKDSKICVWSYYPTSEKIGNLEYMVYYDKDNNSKFSDSDKLIQNIKIKKFKINKQGKYKVNIQFPGNNEYNPSSINHTVIFTGKEYIGGYSTNKLYKTYKKYGHTYKKYKSYWTTKYLNGKSVKKFDGYVTKLISGKKYRLLTSKNVNLKGSFFNEGKYKAYFNGDNKIIINMYGYYYPMGSFVKKYNKIGYILLNKDFYTVYYSYHTYNVYTFNFYENSISKKLVNKFSKYL